MYQYFSYKAMDSAGRIVKGNLGANSIEKLEARLEHMGLDIISYSPKKSRKSLFHQVSRRDLISFCFQMETLLRAGIPLLDGLIELRDSLSQSRFRDVLADIIEELYGGASFFESLEAFPDIFDPIFINLVTVGEQSGKLDTIFKHLVEKLKWQDEILAKTKKLLIYPAILLITIIALLFFLMIYLVPQLVVFINDINTELPLQTRLLIYISDIFQQYWHLILITPLLIIFVFKIAIKFSLRFSYLIDNLKLRIFGGIFKKIILARFATFFALLYSSGISVLECLELCQKITGNLVIENALDEVKINIAEGLNMYESFETTGLFSPLTLAMLRIGETTGELDRAFLNLSYFYNRDITESIDKLQALIEPVMTVVLGLLLAWVMFSILGPIYDTISINS
ncbi:type II secretion system F family protein, partial [Candidatus Marithrix sp. Canyon 246]